MKLKNCYCCYFTSKSAFSAVKSETRNNSLQMWNKPGICVDFPLNFWYVAVMKPCMLRTIQPRIGSVAPISWTKLRSGKRHSMVLSMEIKWKKNNGDVNMKIAISISRREIYIYCTRFWYYWHYFRHQHVIRKFFKLLFMYKCMHFVREQPRKTEKERERCGKKQVRLTPIWIWMLLRRVCVCAVLAHWQNVGTSMRWAQMRAINAKCRSFDRTLKHTPREPMHTRCVFFSSLLYFKFNIIFNR